jgi:Mlc titration factor MtfA (ptsG expression regulator)
MLARIIGIGIIAIGLFVAIDVFLSNNDRFRFLLIPILISLAILYVLSPQISWWGRKWIKPRVDAKSLKFLERVSPHYRSLTSSTLPRFEERLALFVETVEFSMIGQDNAPHDLKVLVSSQAVRLTLGLSDFLLDSLEKVIFYEHPFPSPAYHQLHSSEVHLEDGVAIFAVREMIRGLDMREGKSFNIALYEFARIWKNHLQTNLQLQVDENSLEKISALSNTFVRKYIGLESVDPEAIAIVYFLEFPVKFALELPKIFQRLNSALNED